MAQDVQQITGLHGQFVRGPDRRATGRRSRAAGQLYSACIGVWDAGAILFVKRYARKVLILAVVGGVAVDHQDFHTAARFAVQRCAAPPPESARHF